jgi:hypothetical protein
MSKREEFAEMHGYMSRTCPVHGRFYTDSGDQCPKCEEPPPEPEDYPKEEENGTFSESDLGEI